MPVLYVPPSVRSAINGSGLLPSRLAFAPDGLLDTEFASTWGVPLDPLAQAAGFSNYAAMIATFEGAEQRHVKIARYIRDPDDPFVPPFDVDWRKLGTYLSRIETEFGPRGEVERWDWVPVGPGGQADPSDVVIIERHRYEWMDVPRQPVYRTETISWVLENGEEHPDTKVRTKPYDTAAKVAKEGQMRRGRLMDRVLGRVYTWALVEGAAAGVSLADVQSLGSALSDERNAYVYDTSPAILAAVQSRPEAWLDTSFEPHPGGAPATIRGYIVECLDIYS